MNLGDCRFKVSVADVIRSQYSDQVSVRSLVVSWLSLCGHPVCRSVNVYLRVSGSVWMTSSLELFASFWSGFQRYPIMPRSTKWVNGSFSQTFLTLVCMFCFFPVYFSCFVRSMRHWWLTAVYFFLSVRLLQVMQLQSGQSYQNKAVPSAALLFVYMEKANDLPVSPHCNLA